MKRILAWLLCACLLVSFTGCGMPADNSGGLKIVCSIFPQYDFLREITKGADVSLSLLLRPGQESHDYDPSSKDILSIHDCDMFVYVGGESDAWIDKTLQSVDTADKTILTLLNMVQPLQETHHAAHDHEHADAYDEHVWTSPANAVTIVDKLTAALCERDAKNAALYRENADAYTAKLLELDTAFEQAVQSAKRHTIVVADRFPLLYFTKRYDLHYKAAFAGCATSVEPASADVQALIETVKSQSIPVVFQMELSAGRVAQTVQENTGCEIRTFYACHNLSKNDFENGETYLSLMYKNLSALKEALT